MKIRQLIYSGCLLGAVTFASCSKNDNELNDTDRNFMVMTSISNTAEVDAATLAATKATNVAVKAFAQHMIMEHGMAQTDLKTLGTSVGFAVKDTIDPTHVALRMQLSALSGRAFDSAYIYAQSNDHAMTQTNFQTEQNNGQHKDVKSYANTYRPHIDMHKTRADSIATAYFRR